MEGAAVRKLLQLILHATIARKMKKSNALDKKNNELKRILKNLLQNCTCRYNIWKRHET